MGLITLIRVHQCTIRHVPINVQSHVVMNGNGGMETVMDGQMTLLLAFHVVRIQEFDNSGSVDLIFATALQYYVIVLYLSSRKELVEA